LFLHRPAPTTVAHAPAEEEAISGDPFSVTSGDPFSVTSGDPFSVTSGDPFSVTAQPLGRQRWQVIAIWLTHVAALALFIMAAMGLI
jgi:hypothetical protein